MPSICKEDLPGESSFERRRSFSSTSSRDDSYQSRVTSKSSKQKIVNSLIERKNSMCESIKSAGSHGVLFLTATKDTEEQSLLAPSSSDNLKSPSDSILTGKGKFYGWGEYSDDLSSVQESSQAISVALQEEFPDKPRGDESVSLESTANNFSQLQMVHDEIDPKRPWRKRPIMISVENSKPMSEAGSFLTDDADNDRFIKNPTPDSRNVLQIDTVTDEPDVASVEASTVGFLSSSDITELNVAKQALSESQHALNFFQRSIPDFELSASLQSDQIFSNESLFPTRHFQFPARRNEPFLAGPSSIESSRKMVLNLISEENDSFDEMKDVSLEDDEVNFSKLDKNNPQSLMSQKISLSSHSGSSNRDHHQDSGDFNVNDERVIPSRIDVLEEERVENKDNISALFSIEIASTGLGSTQSLDNIATNSSSGEKASNLPLLNVSKLDGESDSSFDYDEGDISVHDTETLTRRSELRNSLFRSQRLGSQVDITLIERTIENDDEEQNKRKPRRRRRTRRRNCFSTIESRIMRKWAGFHRRTKVIASFIFICAIVLIIYFSEKHIRRKRRKYSDQEILPSPIPTIAPSLQPTNASFDGDDPQDFFQPQNQSILDASVETTLSLVPSQQSFGLWPSSNHSHLGNEHFSQAPSTLDVMTEAKIFSQMQAIPGHEINAHAGSTLSFSNNGRLLAVGLKTKSGIVRIYKRFETKWKQNGSDFLIGECVSDLALSGDGRRLIVSTMNRTETCTSAVKILQYSNELSAWEPIGSFLQGNFNDGGPVAISNNGTRIAILVSESDPTGSNILKAKVFEYRWSIQQWVPIGHSLPLYDSDPYGKIALDLSSDGSCLAIANSSHDKNRGRVEILSFVSKGNESGWVHIGILEGELQGNKFGFSISLSSKGDMIAVGCIGCGMNKVENAGFCSVYSYSHHGLDWNKVGSIMSGNLTDERNGYSLSLTSDGSRITCCGANSSIAGERSGVARIYDYDGKDWHQVDNDFSLSEGAAFGSSVSMSDDGIFVAVGAPEFTAFGIKNEGDIRIYGDRERVEMRW